MKYVITAVACSLAMLSAATFAAGEVQGASGAKNASTDAGASCASTAAEKKLSGAAKNSFMKKCEADGAKTCESRAADKKLAGAAKNSFVKKCTLDASKPA